MKKTRIIAHEEHLPSNQAVADAQSGAVIKPVMRIA